jgi:hypothetical protein
MFFHGKWPQKLMNVHEALNVGGDISIGADHPGSPKYKALDTPTSGFIFSQAILVIWK